ncbi:phosphate ABC transporter substrate-binding protein PstS [Thermogladius sp. 4427co]|uniref:phosphate ABC transporter substrate-binding protein PstS n=1 Tax=Thermogladius sp. 4427co TaxID=3450718 RepID=UPI003F7B0EB8
MSKKIIVYIIIAIMIAAVVSAFLFWYSSNPGKSTSSTISPIGSVTINGAGSTFQAPLVVYWSQLFRNKTGVNLNYQPVGSGAGISTFLEGTADFAGSDIPLPSNLYNQYRDKVLQLPIAIGAVVVIYNLPEIPSSIHLNLTGCILARILRGEVIKWDDPLIKQLNPAIADKLPDKNIIVVYRSDKSGTTNILTYYLSKSCPSKWSSDLVGLSMPSFVVSSPNAIGAKGSDGVSLTVKNTQYSLGYVEIQYAQSSSLQYAAIENREGVFIVPDNNSVISAVEAAISLLPHNMTADWSQYSYFVIYAPGKDSYPLVSFTFEIFWKQYSDPAKQQAVSEWIEFILTDGQRNMLQGYYSLPATLATDLLNSFKAMS